MVERPAPQTRPARQLLATDANPTIVGRMAASTRILLVDDHAVVRSGLRRVLDAERDLDVVAEAGDAQHAIFENRTHEPDVVLLDVTMPGRSGLDVIPDLLRDAPQAKVVILSMENDPRYVRRAFESGAAGYVLKDAAEAELVAAVREVAAGGQYVNPALGAELVAAEAEARRQAEDDPLSEREREVLKLLALGHTNQEISGKLYISVRTAETHRAHIMQKLRLQTRAEVVHYALERGLLESGDDRR
jgi:two-component system, NarL family, response regulator NreC